MPAPQVRIDRITDGLTSLGMTPEVEDEVGLTRISAEVPRSASREFWEQLLALLAIGDSFGLISSALRGLIAWVTVRKGLPPPEVGRAVPVHEHQPQGRTNGDPLPTRS